MTKTNRIVEFRLTIDAMKENDFDDFPLSYKDAIRNYVSGKNKHTDGLYTTHVFTNEKLIRVRREK